MADSASRCVACFTSHSSSAQCECGYDPGEPVSPVLLPPGTILATPANDHTYEIGLVLGTGGFGVTYLAWDAGRLERVAIKEYLPRDRVGRVSGSSIVRPHAPTDRPLFEYGLSRFLQEANVLERFDHANVVRILTSFEANGTAYLVMRYYAGKTLGRLLDEREARARIEPTFAARLQPRAALGVMLGVLDGLGHVHGTVIDGRRWMHRDVKPENIFLRPDGGAILIDFGAARAEIGERSKSLSIVLTPGYAPYEQYFTGGRTQGPWVDVYGCAATLYHAITGVTPVGAPERHDALQHGEPDPLEAPDALVPLLPPELCGVVMKGMAVDYRNRPADASAYRQSILTECAGLLSEAGPAPLPPRPMPVSPPAKSASAPSDGPQEPKALSAVTVPPPPEPPASAVSGTARRRSPALILLLILIALAIGLAVAWPHLSRSPFADSCRGADDRWYRIAQSRTEEDYRIYVRDFSHCGNATLANNRLEEIREWASLATTDLTAVLAFMQKYQSGLFFAEAAGRANGLLAERKQQLEAMRVSAASQPDQAPGFQEAVMLIAEGDKRRDAGDLSGAAQAYARAEAGFESRSEKEVPPDTPATPEETPENTPADIALTNRCEETVHVALVYQVAADRWIRRGWWSVDPGTTVATPTQTVGRHFFFYAYSSNHRNIGLAAADESVERAVPSPYESFEMDDDGIVKGNYETLVFALQNGTELELSCTSP